MRDITKFASFIILLLTATTPIISANSSLQNEATVYSIGTVQYENDGSDVIFIPPTGFEDSILFEYGAESGSLQSTFHWIGEEGGAASDVSIVSSPVRSGSKSIKFTAQSSSINGRSRASVNFDGVTAYYVSYWTFFPSNYDIDFRDYAFDEKYFADGYTFNLHKTTIGKNGGAFKLCAPEHLGSAWSTKTIPLGQWIHFQLYLKLGTSNGVCQVWQDDVLVFNFVNVDTATAWTRPQVTPDRVAPVISNAAFGVYLDSSESNIVTRFIDDIVVATQKVPMSYRVN